MNLLTNKLTLEFPPLYSNENKKDNEVKIIAKFFHPYSSWTWYATEFDGEDTFYGMVDGDYKEMGYFSLKELKSINLWGLGIERDLYYNNHTLNEVK